MIDSESNFESRGRHAADNVGAPLVPGLEKLLALRPPARSDDFSEAKSTFCFILALIKFGWKLGVNFYRNKAERSMKNKSWTIN